MKRGAAAGCAAAAGLAGVVLALGCAPTEVSVPAPPGQATTNASGAVTVAAAASLTGPFQEIRDDFVAANPGVEVRFTFDASSTLVKQIQSGAPADVFAAADEASMDQLATAGLLEGAPEVFARNKLAIVVKAGNPERITGLADLARAGVISLCGAEVPCGRYADDMLRRAGVVIPDGKVSRAQNAKAAFTAVSDGDAVAGVVYATDVSGDRTTLVEVPDDANVVARYPIAVVKGSARRALARRFVDFVRSAVGQARLRDAGFLPP